MSAQQEIDFPGSEEIELTTTVPICKVDEERRLITGVVLEPWDGNSATAEDAEDTQGDVVTAEEIELAAHSFLRQFGKGETFLGFMHGDDAAPLELAESWIARDDITWPNGETTKAGTWLMTIYVADDALWEGVKSGELDGLSLRGSGFRRPA